MFSPEVPILETEKSLVRVPVKDVNSLRRLATVFKQGCYFGDDVLEVSSFAGKEVMQSWTLKSCTALNRRSSRVFGRHHLRVRLGV